MKAKSLVVLSLISIVFTGCAGVGVEVWERDVLSRPEMKLDEGALDKALDDHIYFSKESASGGSGFGGGGCGCN